MQMWCGRIEARLARHWPELLSQLKTTSPTMLKVLVEYAGPAALGGGSTDRRQAQMLQSQSSQ